MICIVQFWLELYETISAALPLNTETEWQFRMSFKVFRRDSFLEHFLWGSRPQISALLSLCVCVCVCHDFQVIHQNYAKFIIGRRKQDVPSFFCFYSFFTGSDGNRAMSLWHLFHIAKLLPYSSETLRKRPVISSMI